MITDPFIPKLQEAEAMIRRGQFGKAVAIYSEILHRDPYHAAARDGLTRLKPFLSGQSEGMEVTSSQRPAEPTIKISRSAPSFQSTNWDLHIRSTPVLKQLQHQGLLKYGAVASVVLIVIWWLLGDLRVQYATERSKAQALAIAQNLSPFQMPEMDTGAVWEEALRFQKEGRLLYAYYRAQHVSKLDRKHTEAAILVTDLANRLNESEVLNMDARVVADHLTHRSFESLRAYTESLLAHNPKDPKALALHAQVLTGLAQEAFQVGDDRAAEDYLKMGRAVFPKDLIWDVRLFILEDLRGADPSERDKMLSYFG